MAGSFAHVDGPRGAFRWEMIENMRDAYEACEEMHWLVRHLAQDDPVRLQAALDAYYAQARCDATNATKVRELAALAKLKAKYPDEAQA